MSPEDDRARLERNLGELDPYPEPLPEVYCKRCGGRVNDWASLPLCGYQAIAEETSIHELRHCPCGSTISREIDPAEHPAALWHALEQLVRRGEAVGRVVRISSYAGHLSVTLDDERERVARTTGGSTLMSAVFSLLG